MEVSIAKGKAEFSNLIRLLESKREESITITRYGKPVAHLTAAPSAPVTQRIGVLKGQPYKSLTQEEFDRNNEKIAKLLIEGE